MKPLKNGMRVLCHYAVIDREALDASDLSLNLYILHPVECLMNIQPNNFRKFGNKVVCQIKIGDRNGDRVL